MSGTPLPLLGSTEPWSGGLVTPLATCVLAPNPSPWTLDGTNTWILGDQRILIVDPGPDEAGHRGALVEHVRSRSQQVVGIVLTHAHRDHSEGARALAGELGVGIRALDPAHRLGGEGLVDGDVIDLGSTDVRVVTTPGHSRDSVSLLLEEDRGLLTGDTILGRGTTLVAWPDGTLGDYLTSLERLHALATAENVTRVLPGHGPALKDPAAVIDGYLAHRRARLEEVRAVVDSGITDPREVVEIVYASVPREVWPAAEQTVRAQLAYLDE